MTQLRKGDARISRAYRIAQSQSVDSLAHTVRALLAYDGHSTSDVAIAETIAAERAVKHAGQHYRAVTPEYVTARVCPTSDARVIHAAYPGAPKGRKPRAI